VTVLAFAVGIIVIFAALFGFENAGAAAPRSLRHSGLFTWLVAGNWPAKVGAGLLIIGFGALIRYVLLYVAIPPEAKLGSGIGITTLLGVAALQLRGRPERRPLYLALAGAAHGVAYLTAYSAYAFFGYVSDVTGLALLVIVAVSSAVLAVNANVLSIAVLAMTGAYLAPALAIGNPGPLAVNAYYLAASILVIFLILARGWRPLIQLSFLFTLAGGLFFGWTHEFYRPQHYAVMQPMLLALVAVHLAMPLAEQRATRGPWMVRLDGAYFALLPIVAAMLTFAIAPGPRQSATGMLLLALLWGAAELVVRILDRGLPPRYLMVSFLFVLAAAASITAASWVVACVIGSVAIVAAAPYLGLHQGVQAIASMAALSFTALHILLAAGVPAPQTPFLNEAFAERMLVVAAITLAAVIHRQRGADLARIMTLVAAFWAALALIAEIIRFRLVVLPQIVHLALCLAAIALALQLIAGKRRSERPASSRADILVMVALVLASWWSALTLPRAVDLLLYVGPSAAFLGLLAPTAVALTLLAMAEGRRIDAPEWVGAFAAVALLAAVAPFAGDSRLVGIRTVYFTLTIMAAAMLAGVAIAHHERWQAATWHSSVLPLYAWVTGIALYYDLLFNIERGEWPVAFELVALGVLCLIVAAKHRIGDQRAAALGGVAVGAGALFLQAMLLRAFGPLGIMSIADVMHMSLPAVVSLMWAVCGGGLCVWGARVRTRGVWVAGATLLVVSAVKLAFLDFGSLGELANILAIIAAGGVFMAVAWLAPFPPKSADAATAAPPGAPV
jgi:uncharacterized membrane protein